MINFEDTRTLAQKSADLELAVIQGELHEHAEELASEELGEAEIAQAQVEMLEEQLARLYRELYEVEG